MSNNKQSSVEWLVEQLKEYDFSEEDDTYVIKIQSWVLTEKHEQAKAMHKEEKIKFATDFFFWWYNQTSGTNTVEAVEKYYNETFGGNNEDTN